MSKLGRAWATVAKAATAAASDVAVASWAETEKTRPTFRVKAELGAFANFSLALTFIDSHFINSNFMNFILKKNPNFELSQLFNFDHTKIQLCWLFVSFGKRISTLPTLNRPNFWILTINGTLTFRTFSHKNVVLTPGFCHSIPLALSLMMKWALAYDLPSTALLLRVRSQLRKILPTGSQQVPNWLWTSSVFFDVGTVIKFSCNFP